MKQQPKSFKYKRTFRGDYLKDKRNLQRNKQILTHLPIGLVALENKRLTYNQAFSLIKTLKKGLQKKLLIYNRISLNRPYTEKPIALRMGKGKGNLVGWYCFLKKGDILLEFSLKSRTDNIDLNFHLNNVGVKLPLKVKMVRLYY